MQVSLSDVDLTLSELKASKAQSLGQNSTADDKRTPAGTK